MATVDAEKVVAKREGTFDTMINSITFNVVRVLGEGAFGEVKLLVDSKNPNFAVAVKCVDFRRHPDVAEQVRKEALLQRKLRGHRNIINYVGMRVAGEEEFEIYLEYADGGELFDRIEPDVGMPSSKAQFYFRQLIDGVKYIHSMGVAHRDIKPENILLTQNDVLKISDFGMATVFRHLGQERILTTRCGTLPYVAPQVLEGMYRAEPSDVWSCGVVLVTMLAGELPWESPVRENGAYMNWVRDLDLDVRPWRKLGNIALALLRSILNPDEDTRATVARIEDHPWLTTDFDKYKGVLSRMSSSGANCSPTYVVPAKKRRCAMREVEEVSSHSQPADVVNLSSDDNGFVGTRDSIVNSTSIPFSQPEDIENLLLNHSQIDESQSQCTDPMKLLVRRMTRFCVTVSPAETLDTIIDACEFEGFETKKRANNQLTVSNRRDMTFVVAVYEMTRPNGKKVMVDFRRSRGDGIEFKRVFMKLKVKLGSIICKDSTDWLERQGLVCSETVE